MIAVKKHFNNFRNVGKKLKDDDDLFNLAFQTIGHIIYR